MAAVLLAGVAFAGGLSLGADVAPPSREEASPGLVAADPFDTKAPDATGCERLRGPDRAVEAGLTAAWLTTVFDGVALLDPASRRELIEDHGARAARADLNETFDQVAELVADRLGPIADDPGHGDHPVVWRAVPAGVRIESLTGDRAIVSVWGTGVVIVRGLPLVQPAWHTTRVELVREGDAWRLVGLRSEPGPQPPPVGGTPQAATVGRLVERFHPLPLGPPARTDCG